MKEIERGLFEVLNNLFQEVSTRQNLPIPQKHNDKLSIMLQQNIRIQRDGLTTPLINFLKEELNFANSEFFINLGKNRLLFQELWDLTGNFSTLQQFYLEQEIAKVQFLNFFADIA